ncbi:MAG: hypothetical protein WD737_04055 [Gemmatimonadota bacterium]
MKISYRWIGLPLVLALAACGGDTADTDLVLDDTIEAEPGAETGMPATEPGGMDDMGAGQTAMLEPVGDSGAGGEATITDLGDQTQVMVRLTGTPGDGAHPGHIHSGRCDNIGGVVQPLDEITTDATGTGTMTATVEVAPMTVMDGQHIVVYHGEGGAPMACANIPTHAM